MQNQKGNKHIQLSFTKIRCGPFNMTIISSRFGSCSFFVPTRVTVFYYIFVRISPRAICWLSKIGNQSNTSHARVILLESRRQGTKCLSVPFQLYQDTVDVYVVTSDKYIERKRERNKSLANTQRL
jgi:hypothetical protein